MLIGYARTSTIEQEAGFEAQIAELQKLGVTERHLYSEQVSSVGERKELERALNDLRSGDTLVVTKLDRLARSVIHLGQIKNRVEHEGAKLRILDLNIDTNTATGELMMNLIGSVAQFEREMMLERQREGIAKAKAEGKYKGRKPTARAKSADIIEMASNGSTKKKIADELGVSLRSVYRVLATAE